MADAELSEIEFFEVKIAMPWGFVAGKWWGPPNIRPILVLHGWLDNLGSFERLIPLLPRDCISYLAVDLPGHGLSSHIPEGMCYKFLDYISLVHRIQQIYKWDTISLMGHSLGAIMCFVYAGIFSEKVDMVVAIDELQPYIKPYVAVDFLREMLDKTTPLILNHLTPALQPAQTLKQIVEKFTGGYGFLTERDCKYLLERGSKKSPFHPGKFWVTSDVRLKIINLLSLSQEHCNDLARAIKCPIMQITAVESMDCADEVEIPPAMDVLKELNPNFEHHLVEGSHHVHLTNPERVAPKITNFILKCRKQNCKI
ncbi:probable serine hydrolase [Sergentomyia squamirostris]